MGMQKQKRENLKKKEKKRMINLHCLQRIAQGERKITLNDECPSESPVRKFQQSRGDGVLPSCWKLVFYDNLNISVDEARPLRNI